MINSDISEKPNILSNKGESQISILCVLGAIAVIVGAVVPYLSIYGESVSLCDDGIKDIGLITGPVFIAVAVIGLILAVIRIPVGSLVAGVVALALSIKNGSDNELKLAMDFVNAFGMEAKFGIGHYLLIAGSALMVIGGMLPLFKKSQY